MKYRDRRISSIGDLLRALNARLTDDSIVWFRGQRDFSWQLIPRLGRLDSDSSAEMAVIKRFKQNAVPHIPNHPATEWEWLFLMQHHRLMTRLLDWTESPLAALYFAVNEATRNTGVRTQILMHEEFLIRTRGKRWRLRMLK